MLGEFELIARFLAPLADRPGTYGLNNDAAVLELGEGEEMVLTLDTMVEGVHFLPEDPPGLVARKLLRVNLSDLAAMGAEPRGYLLSLALPKDNSRGEDWLAGFTEGLGEDQSLFGLGLLGGDTTSTPGPLTLSLTALGATPSGTALTRGGARPGDLVYVSGTIGDGALGLMALQGKLDRLPSGQRDALAGRYRLPQPRLTLGRALLENDIASAAIDVSDGLIADLAHIAETSGVAMDLRWSAVPRSEAGEAALSKGLAEPADLASGGDDYELAFTASADAEAEIARLADSLGLAITQIGEAKTGEGVRLLDEAGGELVADKAGWSHF